MIFKHNLPPTCKCLRATALLCVFFGNIMGSKLVFASGTDFQFNSDFNVMLTESNLMVTIASGSSVASFSVGSTTLTLNLDSGSNSTVKSTNFYTLSNTLLQTTQCNNNYSYVTFTGGSSPSDVVITPSSTVACVLANPVATVTAPTAGSTVGGVSVTLSASATPSEGYTITQVQFQVDGSNVGAPVTNSPYNYNWDSTSVSDGQHSITVVATDSGSRQGTSDPISVTVRNTPPLRFGGAPSGILPSNTTSVNLTLTTDENATCKYGTTAGTSYASMPNTFTTTGGTSQSSAVSGLIAGNSYTYYVRCQDAVGNTDPTDYLISFSIASSAAPTVSVTQPTQGSIVSGTNVTLSATATPSQGNTITQIQFQVDGSNVGAPITSSPYNYSWDSTSVLDGSHALTAVATDSQSNQGTSPDVVVTIQNNSGGGGGGSGGGGGGGDVTAPSVPTNLVATAVSSNEIDVSWMASTDNYSVIGYHVYRDNILVATVQATQYTDTVLQPSTPYSYAVSAYDAAGNVSAKSSPVSATTLEVGQTTDIRFGQNILIDHIVYYLDLSGSKRPYTSAGGFLSFGFNSFSSVLTPNQDEEHLPTGGFVYPMADSLINDHGTVYVITQEKRAGFTKASVFLGLGYKWGNVLEGDTSFMDTLPPIDGTTQAHVAGTLINDHGTVYLLGTTGKLGIPSPDVFNSWGYSFTKVVLANSFDQSIPMSGVMPERANGALSPL